MKRSIEKRLRELEEAAPVDLTIRLRKLSDTVQLYALPYSGYNRPCVTTTFEAWYNNREAIEREYYIYIPPTDKYIRLPYSEYMQDREKYKQYDFAGIVGGGNNGQLERLLSAVIGITAID